jgi:DNA-binding LytR/AlgR family response regulator
LILRILFPGGFLIVQLNSKILKMNAINRYIDFFKKYFNPFISLSIGVFLFILFFQPFPILIFDQNDKLIFTAGLGVIMFLSLSIVKSTAFIIYTEEESSGNKFILSSTLSTIGVFVISSLAFAFYLRYVGEIGISFYIMVKIMILCLAGALLLRLYEMIQALRQHNESLIREKRNVQKLVERYEEDYLNKTIAFTSDSSETLNLLVADVAYIRSADNYVEIVYREGDVFRKKLMRSTLRAIEQQIRSYSNFVRCHRICIINSHFIEKLNKNYGSYSLSIKGHTEKIPVSRQYILKIKELA